MDSREQTSWVFRHIGPPPTIEGTAEVIELKSGSTVFGRGGAADVYIDSKVLHNFISRCHAVVEGKRDDAGHLRFTLHNHGLNGTYINDVRVGDAQQLQEGDTVIFGHKNGYKVKVGETAIQPDSEFQFVFERRQTSKSCAPLQEHKRQEESNGGDATLSSEEYSEPAVYTPRRNPPTLTREATQQYKGSPTNKEKSRDSGNMGRGCSESPTRSGPPHLNFNSVSKDKVSDPTKPSPKDKSSPKNVCVKDKAAFGNVSAKDKGVVNKGAPQDVSVTDQPKVEEACAAKENKGKPKIVQSRIQSNNDVSTPFQHRHGKDWPKQRHVQKDEYDIRPASPKSRPSAATSLQPNHKQLTKSKPSQQVARERTLQGIDPSERSRSPKPAGRSRPSTLQGSEYRSRSPLRGESSRRSLSPHRGLVDERSMSQVTRSPTSDSDDESDVYDEPPVLSPEAEYIKTPSLRSHSPCSYSERGSCDEILDEMDDLDRDGEMCGIPLTPDHSLRDLSPSPHIIKGDSSPPARSERRPSPGEASPRRNDNSWSRNQKGGKRSVSPYLAGHRGGKEAEAECVTHSKRDGSTNNHRHWGKASSGPQRNAVEPDSTTLPKERNAVSSDSSNSRLKMAKQNGGDWTEDSAGRFSSHQKNCSRFEDNDSRLKTQRRVNDESSDSSADRLKTNAKLSRDRVGAISNQRTKDAACRLKTPKADRQPDDSRVKVQNKGVEDQARVKHVEGSDSRGVNRKAVADSAPDRASDARGLVKGKSKGSGSPSNMTDRNVFENFSSDVLDSVWHVVGKRTHGSVSEASGDDSSRPRPKSAKLHQRPYTSFGEKENGLAADREASSVKTVHTDKMKDHHQTDEKLLKDVRVSVQRVSSSSQCSGKYDAGARHRTLDQHATDGRSVGLDKSKPPSSQSKGGKPASRDDFEDTSLFGLEMKRLNSMHPKDKVRSSKAQPDKEGKLSMAQSKKVSVSSSEKQRERKSHRDKSSAPSPNRTSNTSFSSRTASADLSRPGRKVAVRRPRELKDSEGYKPALQQADRGGGDERDGKKPARASSKRRKRQRKRTATEDEEEEDDECLEDGVVWYDGESCESRDCMRPADRRVQWVCCDDCDKWYHTVCVGIMNLDELADEDYHCGCAD